jgi:hypothetical protein
MCWSHLVALLGMELAVIGKAGADEDPGTSRYPDPVFSAYNCSLPQMIRDVTYQPSSVCEGAVELTSPTPMVIQLLQKQTFLPIAGFNVIGSSVKKCTNVGPTTMWPG